MPQVLVGAVANDGTGDPDRVAFQKINKWGALSDATVDAASYPGITKEAQIQAAISDPTAARVWIPALMLPYNASLIVFNPLVKMIGEGTNPANYDARSYGFGLGGVSDTAALAAVSAADLGNTAIGVAALSIRTSGTYNAAFGDQALAALTIGQSNVAFGYQAGAAITTGIGNTAVGTTALLNTTTASYNTAVGVDALYTNIDGYANTAIGADALGFSTHGYQNTAVGFNASFSCTTGQNNTAIGFKALWTGTTATGNVAIGAFAGYYEIAGNSFYVNNQDRGSLGGDKTQSLMYGLFNANPAAQVLNINAAVGITYQLTVFGAFGANGAAPQAAYASGGALAAYAGGTAGFDTAGHAQALYNLVVAIRAALVANGIMS